MKHHSPDDQALSDALHTLLVEPDEQIAPHEEASLDHGRVLLERAAASKRSQARPQRARRYPWYRFAAVSAVAATALLVVALIPVLNHDSEDGASTHIPALTPQATAAEALGWAGRVIAAENTAAVGKGKVWHSVSVQHRHGSIGSVTEVWLDTRAPAWERRYAYPEWGGIANSTSQYAAISINSFDGKTERERRFSQLQGADTWQVATMRTGGLQADIPGGHNISAEMIGGPPAKMISRMVKGKEVPIHDPGPDPASIQPYHVSATVLPDEATRRWIRAAAKTQDPEELRAATKIFMRTTRGFYMYLGVDGNPEARRGTTVRQLIHLLSITRTTPQATRVLYDEFANIDSLKRLPDVTIDGRRALRIQFETGDVSGSYNADPNTQPVSTTQKGIIDSTETVLVIDRATGAPLRTESVDRKLWTELLPARRVEHIGDERAICDKVVKDIPCDLISGEGPIAERADVAAATSAEFGFHGRGNAGGQIEPYGMTAMNNGEPLAMKLDKDGLPLDDPDKPIGYTTSQWGQKVPIYPLAPLPSD